MSNRKLDRELLYAVKRNDSAEVRKLIQQGADVNEYHHGDTFYTGLTSALILASEKGYLAIAKVLMKMDLLSIQLTVMVGLL
jgi:hypothetical protein